jgi:tetratricopeptide (TPR) repeat protein
LLKRIGQGGFGVVFQAEQEEPVHRLVALKVLKLGMDDPQMIRRFEAERQTLALLDHPNIARILDGGTTNTGQPYFVMELLEGAKITDYCDTHRLSVSQRLELFVQVCQAVQHAHQKGVIHRDIKPSNILVTELDGKPVPKVIDFGIAKATLGQRLTEDTLDAAFLGFAGTPAYMSPEQAGMGALDVDSRSDVYSLGMLLYELLTDQPAFDPAEFRRAAIDEVFRIIREQEPPRPSTKLTTLTSDRLTAIAHLRQADPAKLSSGLRGDLDWIVMKCLEKDRNRRYETANGLAVDIERHLDNDVVLARPPEWKYRLWKLIRRNRLAFGAATGVVLALALGAAVSTWQAVVAKERLAESTAIARLLIQVFQSPDPSRNGRAITVAEALGAAVIKLETNLATQPERRAKLQATIAKTYFGLGLYSEAIPLQEKVRDYYRLASGPEHPDTLGAISELANSYAEAGRLDEALKLEEEVLTITRRVLGPENPATLRAMNDLACSYVDAGRQREALQLQEPMLTLSRKVLGPEHEDTLAAMNNVANSYAAIGRGTEAIKLDEELLSLSRKVLGPEHPDTLRTMHNLARFYAGAGRRDEALQLRERSLALHRKVFGPNHVNTLNSMHELANSYTGAGRQDEALKLREEVLALSLKVRGPEHPATLDAMHNLADSCEQGGRGDEALKLREQVFALRRKVSGPDHPATLNAMHNLINSYRDAARYGEALKLQEECLPLLQKVKGPEDLEVGWAMIDLGNAYRRAGLTNEAIRLGESSLGLLRHVSGPTNEITLNAMTELAMSYRAALRTGEATALEEDSLRLKRQYLPAGHPGIVESIENLAACYDNSGRKQNAETLRQELAALKAGALNRSTTTNSPAARPSKP